jgi:YVTN family beta-propeller protein
MKMRLLIAAFALAGLLGSGQSLAQNAYITSQSSGTVSVVDTVTNMVTATIAIGKFNQSGGVAVSPDGSKAYLTNDGTDPSPGATGTVSVIATATNTFTATIPVGSGPQGVAVSPDGSKVYVANSGFNTVCPTPCQSSPQRRIW